MDGIFGIGFGELVMIAIVALIVLGPERLPGALREVAKFIRQVRNLSQEFTSQFGDEFKALEDLNPRRLLQEAIDNIDEEEKATTKKGTPASTAAKSTTAAKKPATTTTKPAAAKSTTIKPTAAKNGVNKSAPSAATSTATATTTTSESAASDTPAVEQNTVVSPPVEEAQSITDSTVVDPAAATASSLSPATESSATELPATESPATEPSAADMSTTAAISAASEPESENQILPPTKSADAPNVALARTNGQPPVQAVAVNEETVVAQPETESKSVNRSKPALGETDPNALPEAVAVVESETRDESEGS
ncbi:MAG: Sec-independent protein translocase protein TatB [Caldilineaceae bacterium]